MNRWKRFSQYGNEIIEWSLLWGQDGFAARKASLTCPTTDGDDEPSEKLRQPRK